MRLALNSATRWAGGERTLGSDGRALNHLDPAQPGDPRGRRRSRDRGAHASQTRPQARPTTRLEASAFSGRVTPGVA